MDSSQIFASYLHFLRIVHDSFSICKFIQAVGDLTCGEPRPLVLPVWEHEILTSHTLPRVVTTCTQLGYEPLIDGGATNYIM
jgi:hypothetical protein